MPKNKPQIFYIHGGTTFNNHKEYLKYLKTRKVSTAKKIVWNKDYLDNQLGKKFEIIKPRMPRQDGATYEEWKTHFERFIPKFRNNVILISQSLGGIFLSKYLSENKFPKKILSTYLICPPYDNNLPKETLAGGFKLKKDLSLLEEQAGNLYLLFSKNDDVVPVAQAEKYRANLSNATIKIYKDKKGHFRITTFPEIIKMIKNDARRTS